MGVACGAAAITSAGRTSDHLVEATLTAVAAYGSFLLAENFGFSGVLATVAAGLLMGNLGVLGEDENRNIFSADGRSFVIALREFGAFIANSLIFLLIGLRVAAIPLTSVGVRSVLLAIGLGLAGRALTVYPVCLAFSVFDMGYTHARAARPPMEVDDEGRWHWRWPLRFRPLSRSMTKS
jgi:CPA1 family monovalent cation:H+ antiporter